MARRSLETMRNQAKVIRALEQHNGRATWADLKRAGCNFSSVKSCTTDGYLNVTGAYAYELTDEGREAVAQLEYLSRDLYSGFTPMPGR